MAEKPESLEGRWDILYKDYPEVYDEFAQVQKTPPLNLAKKYNLAGKTIADIGSGTGDSSFVYSRVAKEVIGVEIEPAMIEVAEKRAKDENIKNVRFIQGEMEQIPLEGNSVDAVIGATLAPQHPEQFEGFSKEAERITKSGGVIILLNIAPGWTGGELHDVIEDYDGWGERTDKVLADCGFEYEDLYQDQEYGSIDKIVRTYGFIFGKKVIEYLKKHNKTNVRWKLRIRYKVVQK